MKTINRYLGRHIIGGLLLAAAVLLPLFGFLDLLDQLDDVGQGSYQVRDAFMYVLMLMPRRFIELAPFIAMLGNVAALGRLAVHQELISLRAAGLSPARISLVSLRVGLWLLLVIAMLDQFVAPGLQQDATLRRNAALDQSMELGQGLGIWSRDKQDILRIGRMEHAGRAVDVEIMQFGADGFLHTYLYADSADVRDHREWTLYHVTSKTITGTGISSRSSDTLQWKPFLDSDQIATLNKPPDSLSPVELFNHVRFLRATGQREQADAYDLALWRKVGGGVTTLAMMLLSVPFVFGSVRGGLGGRLVVAGLAGIGVYLLEQISANAGLLLDLNPALVAMLPGTALLCLAALWLRRMR